MNLGFIISAVITWISAMKPVEAKCLKRLESNAVICHLESESVTVKPFEFDLCTHATVGQPEDLCDTVTNMCGFRNDSAFERKLKWTEHFRFRGTMGLYVPMGNFTKNFLYDIRRASIAEAYENLMIKHGLTFLFFEERPWPKPEEKTDQAIRSFFKFLEELAERLHKQKFHIGFQIDLNGISLNYLGNISRFSNFIDWFSIAPYANHHTGYFTSMVPLSSLDGRKLRTTVCYLQLIDSKCREYWDEEASTPWTVCGKNLYSYDNATSLKLKVDLALKYNISRVMMWGVDTFGPNNVCNDGDPLSFLRAVQGVRNATSEKHS